MFTLFPVLKERRRQQAESLSGGEQQMLAVARALMASPRLLLMDEPSMGLSPLMVEHVGEMIQEIHKSGISVLLVEQNATMALALADRAYVLEVGAVTLACSAEEASCNVAVRKAYLGGDDDTVSALTEHPVSTDVLVIGGGMAGCFAAIKAREQGRGVVLVDKGFVSKSGEPPAARDTVVFNEAWGTRPRRLAHPGQRRRRVPQRPALERARLPRVVRAFRGPALLGCAVPRRGR